MQQRHRLAAERQRARLERGEHDRRSFRAALLDVPPRERDAWVDAALGLAEPPADGPDLPRGCVPYLPCAVDALLRFLDEAVVNASDVFVDVGSGAGRAAVLAHLLTGAQVVGVEVQRELAQASRELAARLRLPAITTLHADASVAAEAVAAGDVFFLYCPFSGERLARLVNALEPVARVRPLRIGCVDLPLPERPWLVRQAQRRLDLAVYRTTLHDSRERSARHPSEVGGSLEREGDEDQAGQR